MSYISKIREKIGHELLIYLGAGVIVDEVNIHVVGIMTEKQPKPALEDLFDEGFFDA